jgi:hypothetical protein
MRAIVPSRITSMSGSPMSTPDDGERDHAVESVGRRRAMNITTMTTTSSTR